MTRHDNRTPEDIRPVSIRPDFTKTALASVLYESGETMLLCTASVENTVPPWRRSSDPAESAAGWVTAEYNMLPGSTSPRKRRDRSKVDGRTTEIQRLIGRSLRAVVDFDALGEHTITIDCDVLQADGGTRTAAITGGYIAMAAAISRLQQDGRIPEDARVLKDSVAAVSVGVVDGVPVLDLDYFEDSRAEVDMNIIMTGNGRFVEVQGTAEGDPFDNETLNRLLELGRIGIEQLTAKQADH
jgi:ribonuclease PH